MEGEDKWKKGGRREGKRIERGKRSKGKGECKWKEGEEREE